MPIVSVDKFAQDDEVTVDMAKTKREPRGERERTMTAATERPSGILHVDDASIVL